MQPAATRLIRKLEQYDVLSDEEKHVLEGLPEPEKVVGENQDIVVEGSRPAHSVLLIEGFCARYSLLPNGKRQITAVHIAGDFVDLQSFLVKRMDHAVMTLTPCRIAEVRHEKLRGVVDEHRHLSRLLWLSTLTDAAIHREWLIVMGAQDATSHLAHFFCEMYVRLKAIGYAQGYRFQLPMTQLEFADVVGLSSVHVNRTLQELRGRELMTLQGKDIEILNWDELREVGMFDPVYLSNWQEPR